MLNSRAWIISSGLVGAISLMLRSALSFSVAGDYFFSLSVAGDYFFSLFIIINTIIFALATSSFFFGHHNHHHDDNYDDNYDHHDHDRSLNSSLYSSFDNKYNNKAQENQEEEEEEEEKFHVMRTDRSSGGSSPEVSLPSPVPEKVAGLRRPPIAPLKIFSQDVKLGDENETMEEMWKRVKSENKPTKPRNNSRMSTSSLPSPSPTTTRRPPQPRPGRKLMERVPTWVKLKKDLSMGREELNSRVEAFIRKFNNDMKLERLESLKRYNIFRRGNDDDDEEK